MATKNTGTPLDRDWFSRICIHLVFLLAAVLIWQGGVAAAGKIIAYGQEQQVEAINKVVYRLEMGPMSMEENQRIQAATKKFLSGYISALLSFEFLPRSNDMELLAKIISATPPETEIESFSFKGRDLTITTVNTSLQDVLEMVEHLEESGLFANVVHTFYVDGQGRLVARYICIAHHSSEQTLSQYISQQWDKLLDWCSDLAERLPMSQ